MIAIFAASALALLEAGSPSAAPSTIEVTDVAYEALAEGRSGDAIVLLEQLLEQQPGDPALLINLGAALLQDGQYERAAQAYRDAVATDERYRLELADGRWIDSRLAARRALESLETRTLAMR